MVCGSPKGSSPELLRELADNAAQVIAVDSGANWLLAAGIMPSLLVGDLDSIAADVLARIKQTNCRLVTVPAHKDFTDFDLALAEFAKTQNPNQPSQLLITNALGGRIDHELGMLGSLASHLAKTTPTPDVLIVEDDCQATILIGESTLDLHTIAAIGSTFSIIPLFTPAEVSATGVEWELAHAKMLPLSSQGVSNIVNTPTAQVTVHTGQTLITAQKQRQMPTTGLRQL
jgi:thiamine pyrophosphokinase